MSLTYFEPLSHSEVVTAAVLWCRVLYALCQPYRSGNSRASDISWRAQERAHHMPLYEIVWYVYSRQPRTS
jgi:hypothetical protein